MIVFDQVSKSYPNGNIVLDNVSFHVNPGEFLILAGPSGAGKTTIGKLLIKEISPSSGIVKVDGDDLSQVKPGDLPIIRRKIGVIFQDYKIIPDKTVFENISLALEIINFPKDQITERVEHLVSITGIVDKLNLFPSQLSGGELQRAAIARAIATEPKILFADEPTGNLDEKTSQEIYDILVSINKLGTTVIMSTHNNSFINKGSRVIKIEKGKIVSDSSNSSHSKTAPKTHKPTQK